MDDFSDILPTTNTSSEHAGPAFCSSTFRSSQTAVVEVERLLELSSQLDLLGDITPVQAWARIRSCPDLEQLDRDGLERLKEAMMAHMHPSG